MTLYDDVVQAVRDANGIAAEDEAAFGEHLQSLTPDLHALRASYRAGFAGVSVTYTRPVTEAYLLAYYPHYAYMARRVMALLPEVTASAGGALCLAVFGAGPAPEVVGIARFLAERGAPVNRLLVSIHDLEPEAWEWARDVSLKRILPRHWTGEVSATIDSSVDIAGPDFVVGATAVSVGEADIVVFQNCLNELATNDENVRRNARALLGQMKPGAVLTMADIGNFPTARRCLDLVEEALGSDVVWLHRSEKQLALEVAPGLPQVVRTNLFREGEYPRRNPFEWRCIALRKP